MPLQPYFKGMNIRDPIEGWFGSENLLTSISGVKALKFDYIDELGEGFSHGKKNLRQTSKRQMR